jgi:hypothetical protein
MLEDKRDVPEVCAKHKNGFEEKQRLPFVASASR